jgi:hypothetical protein
MSVTRATRRGLVLLALTAGHQLPATGAEPPRLPGRSGFEGPLIIENYVWRDLKTDPLDELARARDYIRAHLGRKD